MSMLKSVSGRVSNFEKLLTENLALEEQVALLTALSEGEVTAVELYGCVQFLKTQMQAVLLQESAIDIVRCGGSVHPTFNIAIVAAFIAAGAGVRVAKHCIRQLDADGGVSAVLSALNVTVASSAQEVATQLKQCGLSFLMASDFHPLLSRVSQAQQALTAKGCTTFLNRVLPLCHPASVKRAVIGMSDPTWMATYAEVMPMLGVEEVYLFSSQGIDAVTNFQTTEYLYVDQGLHQEASWPRDLRGMASGELPSLAVTGVAENAALIQALLSSQTLGLKRDVALMNAAVAICLGYPERIRYIDALGLAQESLDSGAAQACLQGLQK